MSFHVGDQVVVKRDIVRAEGLYAEVGEYGTVMEIMHEDGSGKNWIVTVTNRTVSERVFIHAT